MQQYASQPHAAPATRRKQNYREEQEPEYLNLMNDPRIVRGSTFLPAPKGSTHKTKKEMMSRTMGATTNRVTGTKRSGSPKTSRKVNTAQFLEELTDKPIEVDIEIQTKAVLERPRSALFVPAKIGKDVETQIGPGDLFDFDLEVKDILEVLVGRTLFVSMAEVKQETEIEEIMKRQKEFEAIRNIELVEVQRLEAEENRKEAERERRIEQEKKRVEDRKTLESKITARSFAHECLSSLRDVVFDQLEGDGFFADPVKKEIEENYLNELLNGAVFNLVSRQQAQKLADDLFGDAIIKAEKQSNNAMSGKK